MAFNRVLLEFCGLRADEREYERIEPEIIRCLQFSEVKIRRCISFIQQFPAEGEVSVELELEAPPHLTNDLITGTRSLHLLIQKWGPRTAEGIKKDRLFLMLVDDPLSRLGRDEIEIALVVLDEFPCASRSFMEMEAVKLEKELGILDGDFKLGLR